MGATESIMLQPPQVPVNCIEDRFALPYQIQLKLKEKLFSMREDSSIVNCADGSVIFKVKGKAFSLRDKKTLIDGYGNAVCTLTDKKLSIWEKYTICKGDSSDVILRLRVKLFSWFDRSVMTAT